MLDYGKCLVYLAVYNGSGFIRDTLDAILSQDYPNYEIVLTDDCSTDNSREILREYCDQYPQKIRYRENAVNSGIGITLFQSYRDHHDADFFAGTGHDDIWESDYLSKQIAFIKENGCVASFSKYKYIDSSGQEIRKSIFQNELLQDMNQEDLFIRLLYGNFLFAASGVINLNYVGQENFRTFFGYDSDRLQDYEMWLNLSLVGKIMFNSSTTSTYRIRSGGMGDASRHVVQEKYEFYAAIRRALFSDHFRSFYDSCNDKDVFVNKVLDALKRNAKSSVLFDLLIMDFCQFLHNTGIGTGKTREILRHIYFKSGLITKSLHEFTSLPAKITLVAANHECFQRLYIRAKNSQSLSIKEKKCEAEGDKELCLYVYQSSETGAIPAEILESGRSVLLCDDSEEHNLRFSYPYILTICDSCNLRELERKIFIHIEDRVDMTSGDFSVQLIKQELIRLKNSEVYKFGSIIYNIADRFGLLKLIKKAKQKNLNIG